MKRVCVTGADGFIGHRLVKNLLAKNIEVFAVGISENKLQDLKCEKLHFIQAYFEDYNILKNKLPEDLDCFYHFAWNGVYGDAFKDYKLQLSNCKYACDALMIAVECKCKKFVLASTINVLETRKYMTMDSFQPRYTNIYATSKLSAEMICKTLAFQNSIEFNCGVISMVYGENNFSKMITNVVLENLIRNKESNLIDADTIYDIIYVEDVANAFIAIGEKGINQKTYFVGHENLSTFGKIFNEIKKIVNPNGILNFGVYKDVNAIDYDLIDRSALRLDTNFVPNTDFKNSIINTANWLKNII